jgi:hypothetical protein
MKGLAINALVFLGACIIALIGIEIALRIFGDDVLAMGNQFLFYQFDDELGWSNRPNTTGYFARAEYRNQIRINSLGMRDREPLPISEGLFRIAVLGDSFVWGVGADYGERFTEILEKNLERAEVLNYGVSGYGTTQEFIQLDTVLAGKPDYVILAFTLSNDVMESVSSFRTGYNKPFARRGKDRGVEITGYPLINGKAMGPALVGVGSDIRLFALFNMLRAKLNGPNPATKDPRFKTDFTIGDLQLYTRDENLTEEQKQQKHAALDIVADLIAEMRAKVEDRLGNGRFLVAFVPTKLEIFPSKIQANEMGDQLLARLRARGIDVLDPRELFSPEDFWRRDGHWNAQGHQLFAKVLGNYLWANLPAH